MTLTRDPHDPLDPIEGATTRMEMPRPREHALEPAIVPNGAAPIASGANGAGSIASGPNGAGSIASGPNGAGAIASGAIASSAIASGAMASGRNASGQVAPGPIASGPVAPGPIAPSLQAAVDASSWANEVPSELATIEKPPAQTDDAFMFAPTAPAEAVREEEHEQDYSLAWDTRPPPDLAAPEPAAPSVYDALAGDTAPQPKLEEPAGATTWKPTKDSAITDLDLSERARLLQESNAETHPPVIIARRPSAEELMPEEATLAGDPPKGMSDALAPAPIAPVAIARPVAEKRAEEQPTWSPENRAPSEHAAARAASAMPVRRAPKTPPASAQPPTKLDRALAKEALGARQRYLITVAFAILGLIAGIILALLV